MKNNLTTKEINNIAKTLAKANTSVWNTIGLLEDMETMIADIDFKNKELICKLMKAFKRLKKNDDIFVNAEEYNGYFSDFTNYGKLFNKILEELEESTT